jgi:hypothetical protein
MLCDISAIFPYFVFGDRLVLCRPLLPLTMNTYMAPIPGPDIAIPGHPLGG